MQPGDATAGFEAFVKLAERLEAVADECLTKNHRMSARDTYLRVSAYFASSPCFIEGTVIADRLLSTWERHRRYFD